MSPGYVRILGALFLMFLRGEVGEEITVDGDDIWREIIHDPQTNPFGVIPEVTQIGPRLDTIFLRRLGTAENGVRHIHQRFVEPLLNALGLALMGVVQIGERKGRIPPDFPDGLSPQLPPVFGNMQDVLHEDFYVDKNPVALEILSNVLFVLGTVVFWNLVLIGDQPL